MERTISAVDGISKFYIDNTQKIVALLYQSMKLYEASTIESIDTLKPSI
jgi:hypothetical protein